MVRPEKSEPLTMLSLAGFALVILRTQVELSEMEISGTILCRIFLFVISFSPCFRFLYYSSSLHSTKL